MGVEGIGESIGRAMQGFAIIAVVGVGAAGFVGYKWYSASRGTRIPDVSAVSQGYVVPSRLEIIAKDLDNDGVPETLLGYDGDEYLVQYDQATRTFKVAPYRVTVSSP